MSAADLSISQKPASKKMVLFKQALTVFFFLLVPVLLYFLIKNVDWAEVTQTLMDIKPTTLALGLAVALISYLVYGSYDVIGRQYAGHKLSLLKVLPVAFVCYAFTLNLSYLVGGLALRFRLYSRLGLDVPTITKVFTLSAITNWLGYAALAGVIFSFRLIDLPATWEIGKTGLQFIGFLLLAVCATYLAACRFAKRRSWTVFSHKIDLPSFPIALVQFAVASLNWSLMALLIWIFLPSSVAYLTVLGILLLCAVAGAVTHIPGGLGVLEAIFIALLKHQLSSGVILAALIGYRVCYFLIPLAIAAVVYFVIEGQAKNT